jgi:hypothetical protein
LTAVECRVERHAEFVSVTVGGSSLPKARVSADSPGTELMRVFDLVHAAVLNWSPNLVADLSEPLQGVSGTSADRYLEDTIDAITYGLLRGGVPVMPAPSLIDPEVIDTVVKLAARSHDAPLDTTEWQRCLARSIEVFREVQRRETATLLLDVDRHALHLVP